MDDVGLFILFAAGIMVTGVIVYSIWCISPKESKESKVYTYYKKDFDDIWEIINSWCVKYCNKEFPKYHDEIFFDKSEISYESNPLYLEKIKYNYDRYKAACKYPKLWKFLNDAGYFDDLEVITILWLMEDLEYYSIWRTPYKSNFLSDDDCYFFVTTKNVRVLEKRFGVDGSTQYRIKDEFLGE